MRLFGSEKYFGDGSLVLSQWGLRPSGVRQFDAQGHGIQVRLSVSMKGAQTEALVDGKVVAEELFAEFNVKLAKHGVGPPWLITIAVWFVVGLVVLDGLKLIEQRPRGFIELTTTDRPVLAPHVKR